MPNSNNDIILYRTSDLYFSSYLCALDIPLTATESEGAGDNHKIIFVFKVSKADLPRLKTSYFGGSGSVKARKFVDSLRSLKSMVHC
jgi:hypothetical protein